MESFIKTRSADIFLPNALDFMQATHYIIQYQKVLNQQSLRIEAFYKSIKGLVKTGISGYTEAAINNNGYGDAKVWIILEG